MKDVTQFADVAGTPSRLGSLDPGGSSVDKIFAEAIIANEPTTILEEAGIIRVKVAPADKDMVVFPIVRNTRMTWKEIGRDNQDNGSEFGAGVLNQVEYKTVTPIVKTSNIFLPDNVSLLNPNDFDLYAQIVATDAKRVKESDALASLFVDSYPDQTQVLNTKIAGGYVDYAGSVGAASTLDPLDLLKSKRDLSTGSDPAVPDFVLMYPNQYMSLNSHADFAPGASTNGAMMRKAKFNENGDIVRFDGMDIYVSELVPDGGTIGVSAGSNYVASGHPVMVGQKGLAIGRGEHTGIKVYSQDDRLRHGKYYIFDISYDHTLLAVETLIQLRAAD